MKYALLLISSMILAGCGATVTPHYDQYGHRQLIVTCVNSHELCDQKAIEICPSGFDVLKERPPTGIGFYYANHDAITANEQMAYNMTIRCK